MQVRLIVPDYIGSKLQESRHIDTVLEYGSDIARIAGGFTATHAIGGWIDDGGKLIQEPVTVFDVDIWEFTQARSVIEGRFRALALRVCAELEQECVYLRIDGEVETIGMG